VCAKILACLPKATFGGPILPGNSGANLERFEFFTTGLGPRYINIVLAPNNSLTNTSISTLKHEQAIQPLSNHTHT